MSRLPRVAVDLRALVRPPTGIGIYTLEILRGLAARGEFALLGLAHREPSVAAELRELGIEIEVEPAPLGVLWQQLALPRRLARGDVDLIWSPLLTLPHTLPVPAVVTLHDLAALHVPDTLPFKVKWSLLPFLHGTVDRAQRIVVATERVAREVERAFPEARGKLRVVQHGVAECYSPGTAAEVERARERFGAPRGYFLSVGTLEPRKNLELVLDAWPAVRAEPEGASAILLLAGPDGWKNRSLQRRVERLAPLGVRRLGRVPPSDLVELYRGALALVYPSRYEGFGLPVAEALACGVPAVVAEDTSPAEVAGDAGVTCDPDSPDALAAVLLDLLGNAERTRALATRAAARGRRFSWPVAAAAHSAVFREALGAEPA